MDLMHPVQALEWALKQALERDLAGVASSHVDQVLGTCAAARSHAGRKSRNAALSCSAPAGALLIWAWTRDAARTTAWKPRR